jgi:hypothetical protein
MAPSKDRGGSQLERFRSYLHWLAEIGKQLGRSPAAVAGLLRRGVKKLRESMARSESQCPSKSRMRGDFQGLGLAIGRETGECIDVGGSRNHKAWGPAGKPGGWSAPWVLHFRGEPASVLGHRPKGTP